MFRSRLFFKHYMAVAAVIAVVSVVLYLLTVPLIKTTTYEIEQTAGRNLLDVVYDLTNRIHLNIETQRRLALESRKRELRNVTQLARTYVENIENDFNAGRITREQAYKRIYDGLRRFRYGNNDYFWVANYDGVLVSHPDPEFHGVDVSDLTTDSTGNPAVPEMIGIAKRDGEGFYSYRWRRLGAQRDSEKLSYFQDFPDWGFVVGTGVYLDDVEADVRRQREAAIAELRGVLGNMRIAKTGYVYIFDADLNMLVHPNPNIEKTNFHDLLNPMSGRSIGRDLINVADDPTGLYYLWDSPSDPGSYIYEKISWVRHFRGFDWYIVSSVYVEELRRNAEILGNRILVLAACSLALALLLSYLFIRRLTVPIRRMANTAVRVQSGDLTANSGIDRNDEIGILSRAIDAMVARLRENIDTLDSRVVEHTRELELANEKERRTEARLADAQRMQAVGQLSGGLAHDFNNLLTVVIGNLAAARERYSDDAAMAEFLDPALRASRRGAEITSRLLAFSRRQPLAPTAVAIDELVAETIVLLGRSLSNSIVIKLITPQQSCMANIDAGQLENALVNLAFNARDSMPQGGRLTFQISICANDGDLSFDEPPADGEYVRIDVEDTGGGFTSEALQSGFEPFFTTKGGQAGTGSGLGLSMVYGFVKQSGGYIRLSNRQEGGAQVTLLLPRATIEEVREGQLAGPATVSDQTWSGRLVLLVEDDEDVRQVVRRDLVSLGFAVLESGSADEAVPLLDSIADLFLLVTDVVTPGEINGIDLTKRAAAMRPDLPVLLISGFSDEAIIGELEGQVNYLRKPFDKSQLQEAVCELVSAGGYAPCERGRDEQ